MEQKLTEIEINGVPYIRKDTVTPSDKAQTVDGLTAVLIRATSSGVHFGYLVKRDGTEVQLRNARRVWYWSGAASLSQMAVDGVKNPNECKFAKLVGEMTVLGVCEVLTLSEKACINLYKTPVWEQ